ncbi:MAG TPA: hypothetical protein VF240_13955 [Pyrinomonadaceae bacterium]
MRLLTAAAIFHLALTMTIFGLGRHGVLPGTFNHDGIAVSFAPDGVMFRDGAAGLSEILGRGEFINWATAHQPFHVKLYSICFALLGPLLGRNIISAEPLNLFYYLTILTLVFILGREAFSRRVGLLAAIIVALWPSLLIHTTQMLRDQLFIIGMLTFILIMLRWLTRIYSWPEALLRAAAGGATAILVWFARDNLAVIMVAAGLLGAGLLVARQFAQRRAQTTNLVGMALMLGLTIGVTQAMPKYREPKDPQQRAEGFVNEASSGTPWGRIGSHVAQARHQFILIYPDAGSNIDRDVRFNSLSDIIRYLPRAAAIGFFAPFPDMWFTSGKKVGSAGRMLVGVECLMMYVVEVLAICGLWRGRRRASVWLLFLVSVVGMMALGLVVVNVGALYRIRYLFLIMTIILAVEGAAAALGPMSRRLAGAEELSATP